MRFGIWSIFIFLCLIFLLVMNYTPIDDEEIDRIFLDIDQNKMERIDVEGDSDLNKFVRLTARGIAQEIHGGYYLTKWINRFLPSWFVENLDLILILIVLAMISPILFYGGIILIALVLILREKIKERRRKRHG